MEMDKTMTKISYFKCSECKCVCEDVYMSKACPNVCEDCEIEYFRFYGTSGPEEE